MSSFTNYFQCPISKSELNLKNGVLSSKEHQFGSYDDIPWLFKYPQTTHSQWVHKIQSFIGKKAARLSSLKAESKQAKIQLTKKRVETMIQGLEKNLNFLREELFKDFLSDNGQAPLLEDTPSMSSYEDYIFRDWGWETSENKTHFNMVSKMMRITPQNLFVLGSGSARLTYDLHKHFNIGSTFAIDLNPFLLLVAQKVMKSPVEYFEFPRAPLQSKDFCIQRSLKAPSDKPDNLHLIFADALNLPLKPSSAHSILTPWFIDVIPMDLQMLSHKINYALEEGGYWYNFGPLGYSELKNAFSVEEVREILSRSGFEIEVFEITETEYMSAPHKSQRRFEKVLCFAAKKIKSLKEPPYFETLPDWILKFDTPIPRAPHYEKLQLRNKVEFEILQCIDSQRTVNDIAELMMKTYGMDEKSAKDSLIHFLSKISK